LCRKWGIFTKPFSEPQYDGYEWEVAGTDLILVAIGTAVVAEILTDVFQ
jgi:hypothetical protein